MLDRGERFHEQECIHVSDEDETIQSIDEAPIALPKANMAGAEVAGDFEQRLSAMRCIAAAMRRAGEESRTGTLPGAGVRALRRSNV